MSYTSPAQLTPARNPLVRRLLGALVAAVFAFGIAANPATAPQAEALVPASVASKALTVAAHQRGVRYRWGGTSPRTGFDCSGLVKYAYAKAGKRLPRTALQQYRATKRIPRSRARRGDLVFFYSGRSIYHVAMYSGHGRIWHSPRPGKRVQQVRIWTSRVRFGRVR